MVQPATPSPRPVFIDPFQSSAINFDGSDDDRRLKMDEPVSPRSPAHIPKPALLRGTSTIAVPVRQTQAAGQSSRVTHELTLSLEELTNKTRWIRDELEPNIARYGPRWMPPDTVLELNTFFNTLATLSLSDNNYKSFLRKEVFQISRLHRAIILVAGRGTRWPGKLVEICDALIATWTARLGPLDMIRPILYEKGGRLEKVSEERTMKRHELMIKWMGDPGSHISPLRAQEAGHLEFRPGQWWIHPIFAFRAGIIDSPDPHGGITADGDGAYAILLTANDEVVVSSPESFTYRCPNDDKGRFKLIAASLPPKNSIRVMRSHSLRSPWSPPAGVRYDGLYKIVSWSLKRVNDNIVYQVSFVRELDQVSMREVRLHPTAEEVDDYIEYKRLREERRAREECESIAALTPNKRDAEDHVFDESHDQAVPQVLPMRRGHTRGESRSEEPPSPRSAGMEVTSPNTDLRSGILHSSKPTPRMRGSFLTPESPTSLSRSMDGSAPAERRTSIRSIPIEEAPLAVELAHSGLRRNSAATITGLTRVRFCDEMTPAEIREEQLAWTRKDSAQFSRNNSKDSETTSERLSSNDPVSANEFAHVLLDGSHDDAILNKRRTSSNTSRISFSNLRRPSHAPVPDHRTLQRLSSNFHDLRTVTLRKDSVGSTFLDDLKSMSKTFEEWQLECADKQGYVDSCLKQLEKDVTVMKGHAVERSQWDWESFCGEKGTGPGVELERLQEYIERYGQRLTEEQQLVGDDDANGNGNDHRDSMSKNPNSRVSTIGGSAGPCGWAANVAARIWTVGEEVYLK